MFSTTNAKETPVTSLIEASIEGFVAVPVDCSLVSILIRNSGSVSSFLPTLNAVGLVTEVIPIIAFTIVVSVEEKNCIAPTVAATASTAEDTDNKVTLAVFVVSRLLFSVPDVTVKVVLTSVAVYTVPPPVTIKSFNIVST